MFERLKLINTVLVVMTTGGVLMATFFLSLRFGQREVRLIRSEFSSGLESGDARKKKKKNLEEE